VSHAWYWHGTNNVAGQKIMREGFQVDVLRPRGKHYLPPAYAANYFTPRFLIAFRYACDGNRQRYGWMFGVRSEDLGELEIDEDEIGIVVRQSYRKTEMPQKTSSPYDVKFEPMIHMTLIDEALRSVILALAQQHLPPDLITNLRQYNSWNSRWFSDAGRILNPLLPIEIKLKMIAAGCHIAHLEPIIPEQAWRFDPRQQLDLHNAFVQHDYAALDQFAERMR